MEGGLGPGAGVDAERAEIWCCNGVRRVTEVMVVSWSAVKVAACLLRRRCVAAATHNGDDVRVDRAITGSAGCDLEEWGRWRAHYGPWLTPEGPH